MAYSVIENRNIGTIGDPFFVETTLYRGTKEECIKFEHEQRKAYKDRVIVDCFIRSDEERREIEERNAFLDSLSEEESKATIEIDGKLYHKALYERIHNKED